MTTTSKKILSYVFKAVLMALAFLFIYKEYLKKGDSLQEFKNATSHLDQSYVTIIIAVVCLLMFLNWLLECLKWRYLARDIAPVSVWQAIEGVFCGLTWAIITPNRVGEYGGRIMYLPPRRRIHGFFAMAVGAMGQYVTTVVTGILASLWFIFTFLHFSWLSNAGFSLLSAVLIVFFLGLYFNVKWFVGLFDRIRFLKKYHKFFGVMADYKQAELLKIIAFCFSRFVVFIFQYYLLINMFIPQMPCYEIVSLVTVVLFIRSVLPSFDPIDVAIRSAVATTIFAYATTQQVAIVAIFTAIWFLNMVVPAVIGIIFILKLNFFGNNT